MHVFSTAFSFPVAFILNRKLTISNWWFCTYLSNHLWMSCTFSRPVICRRCVSARARAPSRPTGSFSLMGLCLHECLPLVFLSPEPNQVGTAEDSQFRASLFPLGILIDCFSQTWLVCVIPRLAVPSQLLKDLYQKETMENRTTTLWFCP